MTDETTENENPEEREAVLGWIDSGAAEVWKVGDNYIVVFKVPGLKPPAYVYWEVHTGGDLEAFFGPDNVPEITETVTEEEMQALGMVNAGDTDQLGNYTDDPLTVWKDQIKDQMAVYPWLKDPEMFALHFEAFMEDRPVSEAEFMNTEWWRTHNEAQRSWALKVRSDPATAQQELDDAVASAVQAIKDAGVRNLPKMVAAYMAKQVVFGNWSKTYFQNQVRALSDPYSGIKIDEGVLELMTKKEVAPEELDVTQEGEQRVRDLARQWLGPHYGAWDEEKIAQWAGRLRNDPDGQQQLTDMLRRRRMRIFPGFDESLYYDDIVDPVRRQWLSIMGQNPDETSAFFYKMVNLDDFEQSAAAITKRGARDGNARVLGDIQAELIDQFGGPMRRF